MRPQRDVILSAFAVPPKTRSDPRFMRKQASFYSSLRLCRLFGVDARCYLPSRTASPPPPSPQVVGGLPFGYYFSPLSSPTKFGCAVLCKICNSTSLRHRSYDFSAVVSVNRSFPDFLYCILNAFRHFRTVQSILLLTDLLAYSFCVFQLGAILTPSFH